MIFYNPQLIPDTDSATLFCVQNPIVFADYQDHCAGIYLHLHTIIEKAIAEKENIVGLIEDYLNLPFSESQTVSTIASFIYYSNPMHQALTSLRERWQSYDPTLEEATVTTGGSIDKKEAIQHYGRVTLRAYLEALVSMDLD